MTHGLFSHCFRQVIGIFRLPLPSMTVALFLGRLRLLRILGIQNRCGFRVILDLEGQVLHIWVTL